uniref:Transcriptional adapter 3 n=1 Tax=Myotis myotis TaxID=51298 RepID=A0A7J7UET4_MYOMY|nr:transcriptional adaptor 3 [Myotis myotis]
MSELKDCPLQFHDFKSVDHLKVCPRYTAVLARSEDDGIGIEELDTLQLELETLLSSASRRLRVLEAETQILTDWQDKKGDRRFLKLGRDHELGAPPKHGKPKKQKLEGKAGHGPGPGPGRPKSKNLQPSNVIWQQSLEDCGLSLKSFGLALFSQVTGVPAGLAWSQVSAWSQMRETFLGLPLPPLYHPPAPHPLPVSPSRTSPLWFCKVQI